MKLTEFTDFTEFTEFMEIREFRETENLRAPKYLSMRLKITFKSLCDVLEYFKTNSFRVGTFLEHQKTFRNTMETIDLRVPLDPAK